jgi:imidazolonepropionase-like amidohydrolase
MTMERHQSPSITLAAALGALVAAVIASAQTVSENSILAILNTTVLPMTKGVAALPGQSVLVKGDRITAVGPAETISIPASARRVDGRGKFVLPGLADMHVHLEYFDTPDILSLFVVNGVTTVRNMDGRPQILEWKRQAAQNRLLAPRIATAGPLLDGRPPVRPDNTIVDGEADARAAVRAQAKAGYDFIKVYSALSAESFRAIIETARNERLAVAGHVPRAVGLDAFLAAGGASIEHLADYASAIEADDSPFKGKPHWIKRFLGMPVDAAKLRAVAQEQAGAGVWTTPTLIQSQRALLRATEVTAQLRSAEAHYIPVDGRKQWQDIASGATRRMDDDDWKLAAVGNANRMRVARALRDGGVGILAGTDTPNPFVTPGFSLHDELELLVKAGLTPGEALAAATREAARFAASDDWGAVEPGKAADLLVLDANPLQDINHTRRIHAVMLRGRWISESDRTNTLERLKHPQ